MNCPHCANDIPEGSKFCNHCGLSPEAKPQQNNGKNVLMFMLGVFVTALLAVGLYFWSGVSKTPSNPTTTQAAPAPSAPPAPVFVPVTKNLVEGQLIVRAGGMVKYKLQIDTTKMRNPIVSGSFRASGGRGNDIQVVLADEDSLENLLNGHKVPSLYKTQPITNGKLDVPITESGTYYLVFNNRFSMLSPKQVFADVTLTYEEQQQ